MGDVSDSNLLFTLSPLGARAGDLVLPFLVCDLEQIPLLSVSFSLSEK